MKTLAVIGAAALFISACATSDFRAAEEMVRRKKFYNAIEHYLTFVRENPNHRRAAEALYEVGNLQEAVLGEHGKAIVTFRSLVAGYPIGTHTLEAQRRIAEIYKNHFGDCRQAVVEYDKLHQSNPSGSEAPSYKFEIAQCYTLLRDYEQASREYHSVIDKHPTFSRLDEVYLQLGNNAYIGGRYADAERSYRTVIDRYPQSRFRVQAIFGLGTTFEELDDFVHAREQYQRVQKDYPTPGVVDIRLQRLAAREKKKTGLAPGAKLVLSR